MVWLYIVISMLCLGLSYLNLKIGNTEAGLLIFMIGFGVLTIGVFNQLLYFSKEDK